MSVLTVAQAFSLRFKNGIKGMIEYVAGQVDASNTSIGTLASLTTTSKTSAVTAINEVDANADTANTSIGTLASLTTTAKGTLVAAVNELDADVGVPASLTTPVKTSLVAAINGMNTGKVYVSTVAELVAAVAAQTAGQFIFLNPGTYQLTAELTPLIAGTGGGLIGIGDVTILGAAAADSAVHIVATGATSTFEYTLGGSIEIKGGANKIGLKISSSGVTKKTIVYINDSVHVVDNETGVGLSAVNTGSDGMRIYACCALGTGWDTVNITSKSTLDKWHFRGISFDEGLTAAVVDIADNWWFESCNLKHAGMAGGHANNVVNVVNCWTVESTAVAAADSFDFPDAFSPTIL
jgi:hypothetical protein